MKVFQSFSFLVLFFFSVISVASATPSRVVIGTVNMQNVLMSVHDSETARNQLQQLADRKQQELRADEAKIQKMQEDYQKQHLVLSEAKKAEKQREIQEAIIAIQEKSQRFQQEMQSKEDELKEPILQRITEVVTEVSASENVDLTLEVSIAPVLYARESKDLSAKVIEAYNKKFPRNRRGQ